MLEYFHNIGFPCPQLENPLMYYLCLSTVDRRWVFFPISASLESTTISQNIFLVIPKPFQYPFVNIVKFCDKSVVLTMLIRKRNKIPTRHYFYITPIMKNFVCEYFLSPSLSCTHHLMTTRIVTDSSTWCKRCTAGNVFIFFFPRLLLLFFSFHIDSQYSFSFHEMCDGSIVCVQEFFCQGFWCDGELKLIHAINNWQGFKTNFFYLCCKNFVCEIYYQNPSKPPSDSFHLFLPRESSVTNTTHRSAFFFSSILFRSTFLIIIVLSHLAVSISVAFFYTFSCIRFI